MGKKARRRTEMTVMMDLYTVRANKASHTSPQVICLNATIEVTSLQPQSIKISQTICKSGIQYASGENWRLSDLSLQRKHTEMGFKTEEAYVCHIQLKT